MMRIEPQFDRAERFRQDTAVVWQGPLAGSIDRKGNFVIVPQYSWLGPLEYSSRAFADAGGEYGFVSEEGKIVFPAMLPKAGILVAKHAVVFDAGEFDIYSTEGLKWTSKWVVPPSDDGPLLFAVENTSADASANWRWYMLRVDGTRLPLPRDVESVSAFYGGRATIVQGNRVRIIDENANIIASISGVDEVGTFAKNGLAVFRRGVRFGYINRNGEVEIPPRYEAAHQFSGGLAATALPHSRISYIDSSGKQVIQHDFDHAGLFVNERAAVMSTDGSIGYIAKNGEWLVKFSGTSIILTDFAEDGFAYIEVDGRGFFINHGGEEIAGRVPQARIRPYHRPNPAIFGPLWESEAGKRDSEGPKSK